ncbi:hypothetical protein L7F22_038396 [Adiantum nelumboides]|nr:hypothetical protein [Adiantum nelumboides]
MRLFSALVCAIGAGLVAAQQQVLTVSPTIAKKSQFGLCAFIENNINSATDGGIYAELIRNRAFQEGGTSSAVGTGTLAYWNATGGAKLTLTKASPLSQALPQSVLVSGNSSTSGFLGLRNSGFFGIPVRAHRYTVVFYARANSAAQTTFKASLTNSAGDKVFASATELVSLTGQWQKVEMQIDSTTQDNARDNAFALEMAKGTSPVVQLNFVSLFPPTWKGTTARADLAQAIADLKPVYFRLPGGNSLEGNNIAERFTWSKAVGDVITRPGRKGTWVGWDTDGYSLHEAYKLFSQMGAQPILGVFAGYTLDQKAVPQSQLQPYVDEVANQIHYLLDPQGSSALAKQREQDGQPEPWKLPYVQIGNEDWLSEVGKTTYDQYRLDAFSKAITTAASGKGNVKLIASSPYVSPKSRLPDVDQHDYNTPDNFIRRWSERDSWARNNTGVHELEFAVINTGKCQGSLYSNACRLKYPTLIGAVAEATYMMGLERNGDITPSAAYAPLFHNVASVQWTPDLIAFDSQSLVKSTSYYTQWAFGNNRIDGIHTVKSSAPAGPLYWSVGTSADNAYIIKLTNVDGSAHPVTVQLDGGLGFSSTTTGTLWQLSGSDKEANNDLSKPNNVLPTTRALTPSDFGASRTLKLTLPPNSFTVVRIPVGADSPK